MFGTYEKHTLRRAAFSREGNFWTLYEDFREPILGVTVSKDGTFIEHRSNVFLLYPTYGGEVIPYTYFADISHLRMDTDRGSVEFCMDAGDQLRIRGNGVGLRLVLRAEEPFGSCAGCGGIYPTPDGAWEADMGKSGKMLFVPLAGGLDVTSPWNWEEGVYEKVHIDLVPAPDTGVFETAVHEHNDYRLRLPGYPAFNSVKAGSQAAYDKYVNGFLRKPAKGWEDFFKYCTYVTWSHRTGIQGKFFDTMVFMHLIWANYAMSWQQSYNALPMIGDPREAWRLIKLLFHYQVPNGQLPASINYNTVGVGGMQPAFQALALDWVISECGDDFLTSEECELMYPKFKKWLNFWLTMRNAGHGDDRVFIFSAHESGWDDLSLYNEGFPIETPDLFAYMIMLMDGCSRMARKLGKTDEADDWAGRSKRLLNTLVTELWDGDSFVGYLTVSGKRVKCKSLAMFQALVLGKDRLPREIIDRLAEEVMKPEYLTDIGLVTESLESPYCHFGYNFVLGRVVTPCNMLTAMGLYRCGKREQAREISRRVCQNLYDNGIILGFAPSDTEPTTGEPVETWPNPTGSDGWSWTSWAASSAIVMLTAIMPEDE
ncbi:MAG: hypothetical protein LBJ99_01755 [Oscillospiraceae bacterium]|jgi:hypothetical protein|nr:hypothetical protein [Oscillospiraceae bacterium]